MCHDGSVVFRFGNASELQKIEEEELNLCESTEVDTDRSLVNAATKISDSSAYADVINLETNVHIQQDSFEVDSSSTSLGLDLGEKSDGEIKTESTSSQFESTIASETNMVNADIEVTYLSEADKHHSVDTNTMMTYITGEKSKEGDVTQLMLVSASLEAEPSLNEEISQNLEDESVVADEIESSTVVSTDLLLF